MTRRRLTRAESQLQTRERLLEAAMEVFGRRGFYAASVEEVAETAGFSKGAVYSNFASKEELFLALLGRHLQQALHALEGLFAPDTAGGPGERIAAVPPMSFSRHLEEARTWNLLTMEFWLYAMRDERARATLAARYRAARAELTARLGEWSRAGGNNPPMPVEYLAWAVLALGTGLAIQAYLEPGALPDELYRTVLGHLLDGASIGHDEEG